MGFGSIEASGSFRGDEKNSDQRRGKKMIMKRVTFPFLHDVTVDFYFSFLACFLQYSSSQSASFLEPHWEKQENIFLNTSNILHGIF